MPMHHLYPTIHPFIPIPAKWLLRHVYYPSLRLGMSRWSAMVLVFFVSAVFHELILGVPLHMVRFWAFTGIMMQVGGCD